MLVLVGRAPFLRREIRLVTLMELFYFSLAFLDKNVYFGLL